MVVLLCGVAAFNGLCCINVGSKPAAAATATSMDGTDGSSKIQIPTAESTNRTVQALKATRCWLPAVLIVLAFIIPSMILIQILRTCSYDWDQDWETL